MESDGPKKSFKSRRKDSRVYYGPGFYSLEEARNLGTFELVQNTEGLLVVKNIHHVSWFQFLMPTVRALAERSHNETYLKEPLLQIAAALLNADPSQPYNAS